MFNIGIDKQRENSESQSNVTNSQVNYEAVDDAQAFPLPVRDAQQNPIQA